MSSAGVATAVVVGGGIVGATCALRLQRAGIATCVVEPDTQSRAASWNNAGHVAIEQVEPLASWATLRSVPARHFVFGGALDFRIADPGVARWLARFAAASGPMRFAAGKAALGALLAHASKCWRSLAADIGRPDLYVERGHIVVWETPRSARARRAAWNRADIGTASLRDLTSRELEEIASRLARPLAGGVRFGNTGQIADPPELERALRAAFEECGGARIQRSADSLSVEGGRARCALAGGRVLDADLVVVCAGARSAALMRQLGHDVPLIAERGYHIQSAGGGWPLDLPPLVFEERSMIVTRFAGGLRACGFVELAHVDSPPDARKWRALEEHAASLGLPFGRAPSRWMGARPTLPDYLPAIGRSRRAANVIYAFGHQHLGLTLAPVTAEAVTALALGERSPVDLTPFDIERFAH